MTNTTTGILKLTASSKGAGFLYNPAKLTDKVFVPAQLIRRYRLPPGASVTGTIRQAKKGARLTSVEAICGLAPEVFQKRPAFKQLIAIHPNERFDLGATGETSMRLIDLVAPIGKGTRGLIVAPPKAGKTMLLEQLAKAIHVTDPATRLVVLLIDERPEEVTHFRRTIPGAEVFASSSDQPLGEHIELTKLMLAHIRIELECGHNVVVLVDSLTRLVRAFNLRGSRGERSRTLSGGVDAKALQVPRRFFGLARNIEDGGSVTILATILVDTGSRMDQLIFQELKGTGNSEIVLDRTLAEAYIFPAINLSASGTRKQERLYPPQQTQQLTNLQRELSRYRPKKAMLHLLHLLDTHPTNEELLQSRA
ncbi:MAG: transcription termination factor Rho [Ardenticatenaceae bacterium]